MKCNLYFYIANIKEDSSPPTDTWALRLCLSVQGVGNLWFLLSGELSNNCFTPAAQRVVISFFVLQRTTCVMLWPCSGVPAKSPSEGQRF